MWNWQVAALSCGASIYLYDGSPFYPSLDVLIKYCEKINSHYLALVQNISII